MSNPVVRAIVSSDHRRRGPSASPPSGQAMSQSRWPRTPSWPTKGSCSCSGGMRWLTGRVTSSTGLRSNVASGSALSLCPQRSCSPRPTVRSSAACPSDIDSTNSCCTRADISAWGPTGIPAPWLRNRDASPGAGDRSLVWHRRSSCDMRQRQCGVSHDDRTLRRRTRLHRRPGRGHHAGQAVLDPLRKTSPASPQGRDRRGCTAGPTPTTGVGGVRVAPDRSTGRSPRRRCRRIPLVTGWPDRPTTCGGAG